MARPGRSLDAATAQAMLRAFGGDPLVGVDRHLAAEWLRSLAGDVAGAHAHRVDGHGQPQSPDDAAQEIITYLLGADRHGRPRAWALADKLAGLLESDDDAAAILAGEMRSALRATRINDSYTDSRRDGATRIQVRPTIPADVLTALDLLPSGLWHSIGGGDSTGSAARAGATMLRVRSILGNLGHRPSIVDDLAAMLRPVETSSASTDRRSTALSGRASRTKAAVPAAVGDGELTRLGVPLDIQMRLGALAKAVASRAAPAPKLRGLSSTFIKRVLALTWMEAPDSYPSAAQRATLIDLLDRRRATWAVLDAALTQAGSPSWVLTEVLSLVDAADDQRRDAGAVGGLAAAIATEPTKWRQPETFTTPAWKTRTRRISEMAGRVDVELGAIA